MYGWSRSRSEDTSQNEGGRSQKSGKDSKIS